MVTHPKGDRAVSGPRPHSRSCAATGEFRLRIARWITGSLPLDMPIRSHISPRQRNLFLRCATQTAATSRPITAMTTSPKSAHAACHQRPHWDPLPPESPGSSDPPGDAETNLSRCRARLLSAAAGSPVVQGPGAINLPVEGHKRRPVAPNSSCPCASVVTRSSRFAAPSLRSGPTGDMVTTEASIARAQALVGLLIRRRRLDLLAPGSPVSRWKLHSTSPLLTRCVMAFRPKHLT